MFHPMRRGGSLVIAVMAGATVAGASTLAVAQSLPRRELRIEVGDGGS